MNVHRKDMKLKPLQTRFTGSITALRLHVSRGASNCLDHWVLYKARCEKLGITPHHQCVPAAEKLQLGEEK
jgi:hypothetical protein